MFYSYKASNTENGTYSLPMSKVHARIFSGIIRLYVQFRIELLSTFLVSVNSEGSSQRLRSSLPCSYFQLKENFSYIEHIGEFKI